MVMARIFGNKYLQFFAAFFLMMYPFGVAFAFPEPEKAKLVADRLFIIAETNFDRMDTLSNIYPKNQDPQSMEAVCIYSINNGMNDAIGFILSTFGSIELRNLITEKAYTLQSNIIMNNQIKLAETSMNGAIKTISVAENICAGIDRFEKIRPIIKSMSDDLNEVNSVLLKKLN